MPISQPYIPKPAHKWAHISREELEKAMEAYFANGGQVTHLSPHYEGIKWMELEEPETETDLANTLERFGLTLRRMGPEGA
jgi:hypothetical protein